MVNTRKILESYRQMGKASGYGAGWEALVSTVKHVPALCAELDKTRNELAAYRLRYANILAAAAATLSAVEDGEADSGWYLRDEILTPDAGSGGGA